MERIKIAQLGMTHEHAAGKMASIKKLPDIYEIVGVVDDRETATTPNCYNPSTVYDDVPRLTLEQLLAYPGLQAVCVETPNNELVDATMPIMRKDWPSTWTSQQAKASLPSRSCWTAAVPRTSRSRWATCSAATLPLI